MPRPSVSSMAHAKRVQTDRVLRPYTDHVTSSVSSLAAVPSAPVLNLFAWNSADVLGIPHRVGLHPRLGLHAWSAVVAAIFDACAGGVGDGTLSTSSGQLITTYEELLTAYVAEKERHQRRWEYVATVERGAHGKWGGPFAPKAARGKDDAVERVFYFDVVCCSRGQPFRVPKELLDRLRRRRDVDGALQSAEEAKRIEERKKNDAALAAANMSIVVRGKHHYVERPATVMASYVNLSKRRDIQLLIHRSDPTSTSPRGSDDDNGEQGAHDERFTSHELSSSVRDDQRLASPVTVELAGPNERGRRSPARGGQQQLLQRMNTGLRRAVASAQLMREANTYGDRIVELRYDLLTVLRKEVVVDGALSVEERDAALHATMAAASAPPVVPAGNSGASGILPVTTSSASAFAAPERCSSAAQRGEGQPSPLRASTKKPVRHSGAAAGSHEQSNVVVLSGVSTPTAAHADSRYSGMQQDDVGVETKEIDNRSPVDDLSDLSVTGSSQLSPTATGPGRRSGPQRTKSFPSRGQEPSATIATPTTHMSNVPFPLGVCRNRLGELIKLDGGPVRAGSLVTSSVTGELYQIEWVDVSRNLAHCRWVVRGSDPFLSSVLDCSENSFSHGLHYGEHFTKYRYHWFQRLELANRIAEGTTDLQQQGPGTPRVEHRQHLRHPTHHYPQHGIHEQQQQHQVAWTDDERAGESTNRDAASPTSTTSRRGPVRPLTVLGLAPASKGEGSPSWCRSDSSAGFGGAAPSDLDTSMLQYGELPASCNRPDVLSRYAHRASPVSQRRMQQNGLQMDDSDDENDDDFESEERGGEGPLDEGGGEGSANATNDDDVRSSHQPATHRADLRHLSAREIALVKDFEILFPAATRNRKDYGALADEVLQSMPRITASSKVSFLTDVCCDVRLVHLKPTTTFRFLMWIDLGFVVSATRLRQQYEALRTRTWKRVAASKDAPTRNEAIPIPAEDLHRPCDDAFRFYHGGTLRSLTCETFDKTEPLEGCSSHDHDGLAALIFSGDEQARCFCCGRSATVAAAAAALSSPSGPDEARALGSGGDGGPSEPQLVQTSVASSLSPSRRLEITMIL